MDGDRNNINEEDLKTLKTSTEEMVNEISSCLEPVLEFSERLVNQPPEGEALNEIHQSLRQSVLALSKLLDRYTGSRGSEDSTQPSQENSEPEALPVKCRCHSCTKVLLVKPEFLGMKGACPFCGTTIQLPTVEALDKYEEKTPGQNDASPAKESARRMAPADLKDVTVLVVEDDPLTAKWLTRLLESRKAKVLYANDGPKAVRLARQAMPDVVLLDLGLPTMDGYEVMEKLEGVYKETLIPVIVITASTPDHVRQRALKCGAREFMQKPVAAPALESAIHKVMGN